MKAAYRIKTLSKALETNTYCFDKLRITLLTPSLVRLEWSNQNCFTDEPSQKVWFRGFRDVPCQKSKINEITVIHTENLKIEVQEKENLRDSVKITLNERVSPLLPSNSLPDFWQYGDKITSLKGTARTLDNADGEVPLEEGIISKNGFTVLDDSKSYLISENGELFERQDSDSIDVYFFGYGKAYKNCIKDFLTLTGRPPLLPRFALGNWWSRYHKYTQDEYQKLIENFEKENIPLSVAMIDMDWHITQIDKSIGSGWTGYTWNKEYFPKPEAFLSWLHAHHLKASLNVHPAEGVGRHEAAYDSMKKALKLPSDGKTIPFDIADTDFTEAYFSCLHEPLEKQGVDFWWIDWQQGKTTKRAGLDPLWVLNHYHFLDNAKNGKRPLILSRYSGPGSHRYPVGFSGDTIISWKSLDFQPYFTATASNIGYGWWSHDIGGHMLGTYDEELQVRWVQFGVFSPIMRLHCSASPFNHKEPWLYQPTASKIIKRYLQLRHRLIPYLYTMNYLFSANGEPLIQPMYYANPDDEEAYSVPNEYYFGSELICAPVTKPKINSLERSETEVWLPEGNFTDLFTGITYTGGRKLTVYRALDNIPVLLKSGGILPLAAENQLQNHYKLPQSFDIYTAAGNGSFTLYEDDLENEGKSAFTKMSIQQDEKTVFTIKKAEDETSILPDIRNFTIHLMNCAEIDYVCVRKTGTNTDCKGKVPFTYDKMRREAVINVEAGINEEVQIIVTLSKIDSNSGERKKQRVFELLDNMRCDFLEKEMIFDIVQKTECDALRVSQSLLQNKVEPSLIEAVLELLEND